MIKENIIIKNSNVTVAVAGSEVTSLRIIEEYKKGYRVYENGLIGISGSEDKTSDEIMWKKAIDNLANEVTYPYPVTSNINHNIRCVENQMTNKEFFESVKHLIATLSKRFPDFIFSNMISMEETTTILTNECNTHLENYDKFYHIAIIVKDKSSSNVFDATIAYDTRRFNEEEIVKNAELILAPYHNVVDIEDGEYVVFGNIYEFGRKLITDLAADSCMSGSSMFSNKIGQKIFSEKFTLFADRNPASAIAVSFFDDEGTVNENFRYPLIKEGVFIGPSTSKRDAFKYNLPNTGQAEGQYDGLPSVSPYNVLVAKNDMTIAEITKNQKGVLIAVASGGDATPTGEFSTPVQLGYLVENGKIIGRLPEINVSGNLFRMFNEDYVGMPRDNFTIGASEIEHQMAIKMKVFK